MMMFGRELTLPVDMTLGRPIREDRLCATEHVYQLDWLVGCFGFNGSLRQYFSLYRAVSQREGGREEKR